MEQAPQLDPSLESLLQTANIHEEVIMAFRCQDVLTSAVFVALDSTEEGLKKTAKAFGINAESNETGDGEAGHGMATRQNPTRNEVESRCRKSCPWRTDFHAPGRLRASPPRFLAEVWENP